MLPLLRLVAALAALFPTCIGSVASAAPNVVMIIGDDQAWYDHGFMRDVEPSIDDLAGPENDALTGMRVRNVVRTPNIDRLADEGLAFTRGYNPTSLCRPSLASLVTGLYPYQHRITGNDPPSGQDAVYDSLLLDVPSLPRILGEDRGYASFQTGKWWEGHHSTGGFTAGDTANSTSTALRPPQWSGSLPSYANQARHGDWGLLVGRVDYGPPDQERPPHPIDYARTIQPVTDFIDGQLSAGKPFFVWYAPMLPHTPHAPPAPMAQFYIDQGIDSRTAQYYANCELWDGTVGAVLDFLDDRGLADDTLIIYVVDNGWIQDPTRPVTGDYYLGWQNNGAASKSKRSPYDGGIRTPILVRWPAGFRTRGITPQFVPTPVSTIDLAVTVLAAAGLGPPAESWGLDLLDLSAVRARREIYGDIYQHDVVDIDDPGRTLRYSWIIRDGWKFVRRHADPGGDMLFQLHDGAGAGVDAFETDNQVAANPSLAEELRQALDGWYGQSPPPPPEPQPPCMDGLDNDGDGAFDLADPACSSGTPATPDPTAPSENPQCQDGANNDPGEDPAGGIDFDGGEFLYGTCSGGTCPPGVSDPNGDGVADPDPHCVGKPYRDREAVSRSCGLGVELALLLPVLAGSSAWARRSRDRVWQDAADCR